MTLTIMQVDAFTSEPFAGNPAAVCLSSGPADPGWMKRVAREMNLSETALLVPRRNGEFDLRWFTPAVEVDLCGHATLAGAHVLWEVGILPPNTPAVFHTRSGRLVAQQNGGWIDMDFPAEPEKPTNPPSGLVEALGAKPIYVGRNRFDYLVEVDTQATVEHLTPNFTGLKVLKTRGVSVTARAEGVSRFPFTANGSHFHAKPSQSYAAIYWCDYRPRPSSLDANRSLG